MAASACRAAGWRDGPPDSGVRGRPKRNPGRPAGRDPVAGRRPKLSLRIGAILAWVLVGISVWRIKRRPV
jgi:hypothetical protein